MFRVSNITSRSLLAFLLSLSIGAVSFAGTAHARRFAPQNPPPRRPLPKPPAGPRGFEKYAGQDSSARLIAGGATRGGTPRRPVAPLEGAAYDARPFFLWEQEPNSRTYHFVLYQGDVSKDASAPIIYQTDVTTLELSYPKDGLKLEAGKLYSWRVSTPTSSGKQEGPVALFTILAGKDATEVKQALTTAGLLSAKSSADRLDQARVFENFGVWYDALRIASELAQNPNDKDAQAYYDELLDKLETGQQP
jgi:hypothetical protein